MTSEERRQAERTVNRWLAQYWADKARLRAESPRRRFHELFRKGGGQR